MARAPIGSLRATSRVANSPPQISFEEGPSVSESAIVDFEVDIENDG